MSLMSFKSFKNIVSCAIVLCMHIFSGVHKNRSLLSPKGQITRPTSGRLRETLFNICQHYVERCRFLDLFAGSGAMGLEALSRGALQATFIDNSKESIRCIQANVHSFKEEDRAKVIYGDVFDQLGKLAKEGHQFDIIYADPPYETMSQISENPIFYSTKLLKTIDEQLINQIHLLAPNGVFFLEESAKIPLENGAFSQLKLKNSRRTGRTILHYYVC